MDDLISPSIDIEKVKGILIKYFAKFYGEKHEDYIRQKLDECLEIILYNNVDDVASMLCDRDNRKKSELTIEFLRENGIEIPEDIATQIIENDSSYLLSDIPGAKDLVMLYFDCNNYGDNKNCGFRICFMNDDNSNWVNINRQKFLKALGADCDGMDPMEFLQSDAGRPYLEIIEKQKQIIGDLDVKYQEFRKPYEACYPIIDRFVEIKKQINIKYSLQFLSSISDFLSDRDKDTINMYMSNNDFEGFNRFIYDLDCYRTIFQSLQYGSLIDNFSSEVSLELESSKTLESRKKLIINDRMEYFRLMGLNPDEKSYEELMSSLDPKDIPDAVIVDGLIETREKYRTMADNEYCALAINYGEILDKANSFNLVYGLGLSVEDLASSSQFMSPNVRKDSGEAVGVVCFSPLKAPRGYADVMFAHEVAHALELLLLEILDNNPIYKVGFSLYDNGDSEISDFEVSNETINHLIAMEITTMMHENGVYIFDESRCAKIRHGSEYEHNNVILEPFYQTFKQDILDSRLSDDLSLLMTKVGEDNFNALNSTAKRYSELPYYNLMNDIRLEKDTPLRSEGLSLIGQAADVTGAMKSYSANDSVGQNSL